MAFGFKGSRVVGRSNAVFCAWHPKKSDGTIQSESEKIVAEHVFLDIYIYISIYPTDIVPKYLTKDKTFFWG
jgi:hypothetical protein